ARGRRSIQPVFRCRPSYTGPSACRRVSARARGTRRIRPEQGARAFDATVPPRFRAVPQSHPHPP
ncbi:hypothetical protein ABZV68_33405, partial [Streptomyces clavifer]|uniref:hypothetical protein n=1 Tax=Streptomyces clavifer TaxID=68188 RepID=UPI0033B134F3